MELSQKQLGELMAHLEIGQTLNIAKILIKYFEEKVEKEASIDEAFKAGYVLSLNIVKELVEVMMDRADKRAKEFEKAGEDADKRVKEFFKDLEALFNDLAKEEADKDGDIRAADFNSNEEFTKWFHGDIEEED